LEEIQNNIIKHVQQNNWPKEPFENVYHKIINNKYLFEEDYLKPLSNKIYKAQIMFKNDYQGSGTYLKIYKNNDIVNKILFINNAYSVIKKDIKKIEWINETTVKIYSALSTKYFWEININGSVNFTNEDTNNAHQLYTLGQMYYSGTGIIQDKEKGIELIKKSAQMNYKHGINWIKKNI
jgi:TPR repeat protein